MMKNVNRTPRSWKLFKYLYKLWTCTRSQAQTIETQDSARDPTSYTCTPRAIFHVFLCRTLLTASTLLLSAAHGVEISTNQLPEGAQMSYLDNEQIKVGVDLKRGGAIVFLAPANGENLVNNFDLGRQIQLSFYSGPIPFESKGQRPIKHWEHIGWNPIQTGDDFDNPSRILAHSNDGHTLYVKTTPMQWPLNNIPGECTFESWLEIEGAVLKAKARLNNARTDHTQYQARLQELPAMYANATLHRVLSYTGIHPFTGQPASPAPAASGQHPWSMWLGTEHWAALLNTNDWGLGLITPGRIHFTGGFAGQPGHNRTLGNATGYLAGQGTELIDHNITYTFEYEIVVGSLDEIRARAATHQSKTLPAWTFDNDRQGWHYLKAGDAGWPIKKHLHIALEQEDPQLISPFFCVSAKNTSRLVIEAAYNSPHRHATLFWQRHGEAAPTALNRVTFPINADHQFHRYVIDLAAEKEYYGAITRLRLDPVPTGKSGDWVKIRSIRFE